MDTNNCEKTRTATGTYLQKYIFQRITSQICLGGGVIKMSGDCLIKLIHNKLNII